MLSGHVTWLYATDIAHDMRREPLKTVLGRPVEPWLQSADHRARRQSFFHRPQVVRLPDVESPLPGGGTGRLERTLKILPVGGVSLAITAPFTVQSLDELVAWHEAPAAASAAAARSITLMVIQDLKDHLIQPVENPEEAEAYTVFRMDPPTGADVHEWLRENERVAAALLTQERDPARLCAEEVQETLSRRLGYYRDDLVVVDWDAALVIDREGPSLEVLHVLELANLQICELAAYDRILDAAMERSYADIGQKRRLHKSVPARLGELRIDLSRLSDELTHAGKYLGDWHLARVYDAVAARFHLGDWKRMVDEKLKTLDDLYQMLKNDQFNRFMMVLETSVVVILILEMTVILYPVLRRH